MTWMLVMTAREMGEALRRRRSPLRLAACVFQSDRVGPGSVPLVALVSFFLGLTMALLTGYQLRTFGQEHLVAPLVAIAFTRELGPLLTGIVLAARIGAAFTAELGTMTVADEVEAIEAMGIGPLRYLIAPRLLAVTLLMPALSMVGNACALVGASLISAWAFSINYRLFFADAINHLLVRDLISGTLKSLLFGVIIGMVACYRGLSVRGGAAGVGTATTSSVVTAITSVIGFDTMFNLVLVRWGD